MIRAVNLKLNLTEDQQQDVINTIHTCNQLWNRLAEKVVEHNSYSFFKIDKLCYHEMRSEFPDIPSGLIQSVEPAVCGAYKVAKKRMVKKSLSYPVSQVCLTVRGDQITFSTVNKRVKTIVNWPKWFNKRYKQYKVNSGVVKYYNDQFYLCVFVKLPDAEVKDSGDVVGIDRGIYNIAVTSDGKLYSNNNVRKLQRKMLYNRRNLQKKGTASAKRKLKKLSGKQKRFVRDVNHCITKKLANNGNVRTYVLEDLKNIRKQNRGKTLNNWLGQWSYFEFETLLQYKCEAAGISVEYVNPAYTSQTCNQCNMVSRSNRLKNYYKCECGYQEHSDINAAKNIRDKYLSQILKSEQAEPSTSR